MSRAPGGRQGGRYDRDRGHGARAASTPLFDPSKPRWELVDPLAQKQAEMMPSGRDALKSSQLRRFFGEVKDLYRRLETGIDYKRSIEPMFKMLRSKASYAWRAGDRFQSKIPREFHDFIENGVAKVQDEEQFRAFVQHFEAVVGFLYGLGKVGK